MLSQVAQEGQADLPVDCCEKDPTRRFRLPLDRVVSSSLRRQQRSVANGYVQVVGLLKERGMSVDSPNNLCKVANPQYIPVLVFPRLQSEVMVSRARKANPQSVNQDLAHTQEGRNHTARLPENVHVSTRRDKGQKGTMHKVRSE